MTDNKSQWLTTRDIQQALVGRRDNDVKVEIRGVMVPLEAIYYDPTADSWILAPYQGEDLRIALAESPEDDGVEN